MNLEAFIAISIALVYLFKYDALEKWTIDLIQGLYQASKALFKELYTIEKNFSGGIGWIRLSYVCILIMLLCPAGCLRK